MDVHAEATSEKLALARVFDGTVNVIFGTHTHVPTADLQILPGGSAYVTDLGMTGPRNGILGTDAQRVIQRMRTHLPTQFTVADGEIRADAVLFELDGSKVKEIKRLIF
jgi:calcineurin-like phosphoesterase